MPIRRLVLTTAIFVVGFCRGAYALGDRPYLNIPIHQSMNRGGALRYAVWVKVGDRTVEALLDTGSTGLRVLASVMPGEVTSASWTDPVFGGTIHMKGPVVPTPVGIGSLHGRALVEVVQEMGCVAEKPDCNAKAIDSGSLRIGGDAFAHQGYSAILGIRLSPRGGDIGNPLEAVGAKRWIVDLPRPYELAPGHLILEPDAATASGFTTLKRTGSDDADGCVVGDFLPGKACGAVLFDTGAPAFEVFLEGAKTESRWRDHAAGVLTLTRSDGSTIEIDAKAGANGGVASIGLLPPMQPKQPKTFILAGVSPFFSYDLLYDAAARTVAVKQRPPLTVTAPQETEGSMDDPLDRTGSIRPRTPTGEGRRAQISPIDEDRLDGLDIRTSQPQ